MADIAVVPAQSPGQDIITLDRVVNPYRDVWWTAQSVSDVPETVMGWLIAQGWEITNVTEVTPTTTPRTYTYELGKQGMQPWLVLLNLCNSYTTAANEARFTNEVRYNEIIVSWASMITSSQAHFDAQILEQNTALGAYISDLGTYMDALELLVTEHGTTIDAAVIAAALLVTQGQTEQDAYELVVEGILGDLLGDYVTHEGVADGLLDGLGTTELARINEQFAATLSVQLQGLIDNGLYGSGVAADITARNARDRDEQIQTLRDRLNREKLENQHKLYGQQVALRTATLGATDGMHALALEVLKYRAAQAMGHAESQAEHKHKAIAEMMNVAVARLQGARDVAAENQKLMAYQLDERNKLLIGLYAFVERREDIGPKWKDMASMIAGLGDSAGGWIQP